jgi:predicted dehydrogenase
LSTIDEMDAAVFGTGGWARRTLLPALASLPDVRVVGCVDTDVDRARAAAPEFGVATVHRTLADLFAAHPRLDLLVVAAPDHLHVDAVRAALDRDIAVYCEKPLGNTADAVVALAGLAAGRGVPATVGYSFRYAPAVQALRADLVAGRLGDVWLIELFEHNPQFHPRLGKPMTWKGDPAYVAAGSLLEYGSHVLDLAQWLLGPVDRVSSDLVRVRPGAGVDDLATLQLQFAGGPSGTLLCGWVLSGGYPGITIRLHTGAGLAEVVLSDLVDGGQRYTRTAVDGTPIPTPEPAAPAESYAVRHLRDLLGGRSSTLPTLLDAARTHRVVAAALAATDRWQRVDS